MDVIVVGSCNTDLTSYVPRLPSAGETLHGTSFSVGFGGKGANQCVAAARLGAKCAMVAKVGTDSFGTDTIQNFKDNGVNVDHVQQINDVPTGVAPIFVFENGQNAIVVVCGANMSLSEVDVLEAEHLIAKSKVLLCQLESLPETSLEALKLAKKHGVKSILNPAPAQADLDPDLFKSCDIFCPNESEAETLIKKKVSSVEDAKTAVKELQALGCSTVIITLGENGVVYSTEPGVKPIHVPAPKVKAVDTTGAGDSFMGSLAYYLSCHPTLPIETAIKHSCAIAALSVQKPGTQKKLPLL